MHIFFIVGMIVMVLTWKWANIDGMLNPIKRSFKGMDMATPMTCIVFVFPLSNHPNLFRPTALHLKSCFVLRTLGKRKYSVPKFFHLLLRCFHVEKTLD